MMTTMLVPRARWLASVAALTATAASAAPVSKSAPFNCGSALCGTLQITADDQARFRSLAQLVPGDDTSWAAVGTAAITATALPLVKGAKHWAWMQAVIVDTHNPWYYRTAWDKSSVQDELIAPYPDMPPGGTKTWAPRNNPAAMGEFPSDSEPWYYRNKVGELELFDAPGAITDFSWTFESWLVCLTEQGGTPASPDYTVVPLIGFTWTLQASKGADGIDNGDIAGDSITEYAGQLIVGEPTQAGQPSSAFKAGYAKYFNINYLENNDTNCLNCIAEPPLTALLALGLSAAALARGLSSARGGQKG